MQGLEEASRLYFGESNVEGMLATLLPLHDMVRHSGASTLKEIAFVQSYGRCVRLGLLSKCTSTCNYGVGSVLCAAVVASGLHMLCKQMVEGKRGKGWSRSLLVEAEGGCWGGTGRAGRAPVLKQIESGGCFLVEVDGDEANSDGMHSHCVPGWFVGGIAHCVQPNGGARRGVT
eukprot:1162062-Pelagomonas_calceolata.AAC.2